MSGNFCRDHINFVLASPKESPSEKIKFLSYSPVKKEKKKDEFAKSDCQRQGNSGILDKIIQIYSHRHGGANAISLFINS